MRRDTSTTSTTSTRSTVEGDVHVLTPPGRARSGDDPHLRVRVVVGGDR